MYRHLPCPPYGQWPACVKLSFTTWGRLLKSPARNPDTGCFPVETNLRNFGNSVGLVIPKPVREALRLHAGQTVMIEQTAQGGLLVSPCRKKYLLEDLLAQCDADAPMPQEVADWESMPPVGEEV